MGLPCHYDDVPCDPIEEVVYIEQGALVFGLFSSLVIAYLNRCEGLKNAKSAEGGWGPHPISFHYLLWE